MKAKDLKAAKEQERGENDWGEKEDKEGSGSNESQT